MGCAGLLALADLQKLKCLEIRECDKVGVSSAKEVIKTLQSRLPALVDVKSHDNVDNQLFW